MPLLTYLDLEAHKNITLIEDGQNLANTMAEAVVAWAKKRTGRTFGKSVRTEFLDGGQSRYYLSGLPIDTCAALSYSRSARRGELTRPVPGLVPHGHPVAPASGSWA